MQVPSSAAHSAPPKKWSNNLWLTSQAADKRCKAIERYQILDTPTEPDFDDIATLAAAICETRFAAISFVADDRQWFKAEVGLGIRQTPIGHSFCAHAIQQHEMLVVNDAERDPRFATSPLVMDYPKLRFYAGVPILAFDGTPIATLCVLDPQARPIGLTETQKLALAVLANQVQAQLKLRFALIEQAAQSAEKESAAKALRWIADHDSLTRLPNRAFFQLRLDSAIKETRQSGGRAAVMLIDVDHFKQINDSMGHDAGDAILRSFAERLQSAVRDGDTVARLGGDEFGIVLASIGAGRKLQQVMRSLKGRLKEPLDFNGRLIDCHASIGIAVFPDHAQSTDALIKCGDLALASAKLSRDCAVSFHPEMADDFAHQTQMLSFARTAIANESISPFYQPKIDLKTGAVVGFEALLRWTQPSGELGFPKMISSAFDDRVLAKAISERMINRVIDDVRGWVDKDVPFGRVAINSCAADFASNDFAEKLLLAIESRGLNPNLFEVEVTEGVVVSRGSHHVLRALKKLSACGVRIALDDFGTGFASFTHLKQVPVDILKVDQSFIAGLGTCPDDTAIVCALLALGQSLGIETVAEGIETAQQARFLRQNGCSLGQGYLFGHAEPASRVPALINRISAKATAKARNAILILDPDRGIYNKDTRHAA